MPNRDTDKLYLPYKFGREDNPKQPSPESAENFKRIERWANRLTVGGGDCCPPANVVFLANAAGSINGPNTVNIIDDDWDSYYDENILLGFSNPDDIQPDVDFDAWYDCHIRVDWSATESPWAAGPAQCGVTFAVANSLGSLPYVRTQVVEPAASSQIAHNSSMLSATFPLAAGEFFQVQLEIFNGSDLNWYAELDFSLRNIYSPVP